ncbi:MAG: hypothetical protein IT465_03795 [Moraxellaceae bacterium]|jgi:adenylate cyclase|nr:hypothetical protein [Moraxellaceae bacterium]
MRYCPKKSPMNYASVIAGVIGAVRFSYDIWGDTVNTASRMESHGQAGRIQISQQTKERLGEDFALVSRGMIDVKGKGEMATWWLEAERKLPLVV